MVPTVEVRLLFLPIVTCKFLILAYDDHKVRSFCGTGC